MGEGPVSASAALCGRPGTHRRQEADLTSPLTRRHACVALAGTVAPWAGSAQEAQALEIGLLPNISARVLLAQYQPLRDYLARELKRAVQVSTAPSWTQFHRRTLALEYDLIVTAAHVGRVAQLDRGWVPLLSIAPDVRALFVTPAARPLAQLAELRAQTLALSNPQSLVAMRGLQWLAEQGLQRERDFRTSAVATDDSVGHMVLRGDARAAICSAGEFRAIPDGVKAQLVVHSTFAEVPGFMVMASPRLGGEARGALRENLLQFARGSEEGKAFFAATGFQALRDIGPGLMESLDAFAEATRRALAA